MKSNALKITVLVFLCPFNQGYAQETDAKAITDKLIQLNQQEAADIKSMEAKIISSTGPNCDSKDAATECLKKVIKGRIIMSDLAAVEFAKLMPMTLKKDIQNKKLHNVLNFLVMNDCILSILEQIDLSKSWLATYKPTKSVDVKFVEDVKKMNLQNMDALRNRLMDQYRNNFQKFSDYGKKNGLPKGTESTKMVNLVSDLYVRKEAVLKKVFTY